MKEFFVVYVFYYKFSYINFMTLVKFIKFLLNTFSWINAIKILDVIALNLTFQIIIFLNYFNEIRVWNQFESLITIIVQELNKHFKRLILFVLEAFIIKTFNVDPYNWLNHPIISIILPH